MALAKRCDRCGKLYVPEKFIIDGDRVNGVSIIDRNEKTMVIVFGHVMIYVPNV